MKKVLIIFAASFGLLAMTSCSGSHTTCGAYAHKTVKEKPAACLETNS